MGENNEKSYLASLIEVFLVSLRLGLTSFGGPIAHLGYYHSEYVQRRKWLDEKSYADLVALCQFLPGPASSQVHIGIGTTRAGVLGGFLAFVGFTLPSMLMLITFALVLQTFDVGTAGWIHGLKIVAVVVVADAVVGMSKKLTPDLPRKAIALFTLVVLLLWQTSYTQIGVILVGGFVGYLLFKNEKQPEERAKLFPLSKKFGAACLTLFFGLLVFLPIARELTGIDWIAMFDSFYRSGSLVFGGGHVVLPLLEREFVPTGLLSEEAFLAGYGAAQAVPGPIFTFASYIGTVISGWKGGVLATIAIFLPAFLVLFGTLPFWDALRQNSKVHGALKGVNAAVIGILIAALYHPIWTSAVLRPIDFALGAVLYSMLVFWKIAPWIVVVTGALIGALTMMF